MFLQLQLIIYTLTGASAGCSNTSTVSLTVNALPTLTATSNPTVLCAGSSATLTGNGSYIIHLEPRRFNRNNNCISYYNYRLYINRCFCFGCTNTQTVSLTVNQFNINCRSKASNTICAGSTATIGAIGATSFTWNQVT